MHEVVGVIGRRMTRRAVRLAEEERLAAHLLSGGFCRIELSINIELGSGRKVEYFLKLRHEVNLASTLESVDALLGSDHCVAVKVGRALLEFGEVLDRLQTALRAEQTLDVDAAQRCGLDPVPELLRADVADEVERGIRMAVGVAVEACDATARARRSPVLGLIELLLREGRKEQTQTFDLLGIEDAIEQLVIILDGDEFSLQYVAEVRPRGQVARPPEFRQHLTRQINI